MASADQGVARDGAAHGGGDGFIGDAGLLHLARVP
jgi:hypothetical protein